MAKDGVSKHFDLNDVEYDTWMGTADHGMMHYGDHSNYERNYFEKLLRKIGFASRKEIKESVIEMTTRLVEKADITEEDTVLEVGCGRGGNSFWIAENTGAEVIGLDINQNHIDIAREEAKKRGLSEKISFIQGDLDDLPDEEFDVFLAIESICYSENEKRLLKDIYNKLNTEGRLIVSDGFRDGELSKKEEELMELTHKGWGVDYLVQKDDFHNFMQEAGFRNIEVEDIKQKIMPTSQYLHRASILMIPYINLRKFLASGEKKERYTQVRSLITTGRYQYLTTKKGLMTQCYFYGEKNS